MFIQDRDTLTRFHGAALETGNIVRRGCASDGLKRDVVELELRGAAISCCATERGALRDRKSRAAQGFRVHAFKEKIGGNWNVSISSIVPGIGARNI
jgi:hypothetical protein